MRMIPKLTVGLGFVMSPAVWATEPVLVFTTIERVVAESRSISSEVYRLDEANIALRMLDQNLPGNFEKAYPALQTRMNTLEGAAALERLENAYRGVVLAWELGIERLPAIVFDRQFVVYGVTSVDKAAQLLKESRR